MVALPLPIHTQSYPGYRNQPNNYTHSMPLPMVPCTPHYHNTNTSDRNIPNSSYTTQNHPISHDHQSQS